MGVYENLLPGKENALTPEYLTVKCHFSSVRMLQKQIEAELQGWQSHIIKHNSAWRLLSSRSRRHNGNPKVYSYHLRIEERIL